MEPNAKDIIHAMKCCYTDDGSCLNCPYMNDYNSCVGLSKNALALIKQLTEEIADLKAISEQYQKQFEDCYEEKAKLTEENEAWQKQLITTEEQAEKSYYDLACEVMSERHLRHQAEAMLANGMSVVRDDTVRAMQTEINKTLSALCKGDVSEIHRIIDQIAKEMLEGNGD